MKKIHLIVAVVFSALLLSAHSAGAAYAWYYGKITRVWRTRGRVVLTLDTDALDDCKYKYAYFIGPVMNDKEIEASYLMALSAFYTRQEVGLVIDKDNKIGGQCYADSIDIFTPGHR